jgi:hypothetical protein
MKIALIIALTLGNITATNAGANIPPKIIVSESIALLDVQRPLVSADPKYGYSKEKPIKVGSPAPYGGPSAERDYLNMLRDEAGKRITFERMGSIGAGPDGNIIDRYKVQTSTGREVFLYIDMYHPTNDPAQQPAPKGFSKVITNEVDN